MQSKELSRLGLVALCAWVITPLLMAAAAPKTGDAPPAKPATQPAEVYTGWPFDAKEAAKRQDDTAKALGIPKLATVDLGGVAMKFVLIPAGKFQSDNKKDQTVAKPFYMAQFKVTQAQYQRIMGANPSVHQGAGNPVDTVTWAKAAEFCKKASEKTKKHIALPTDLQWEGACRGGTATTCYWGDDMSKIGDYCWWHDNCGMTTHPVGLKTPNAFGLYDMMGLLWEWTANGGEAAAKHGSRGATFGSKLPMFKSSIRWDAGDAEINDRFGMRVMMDVE